MEEPVFPDKAKPPTDADLARVLGRTQRHWDALATHAEAAEAGATPEWKYYTKKSGWSFVVRGKRRNLIYMRPTGKAIAVALVFGEKAARAAEHAGLPGDVLEIVRQAPRYPEGRGIRLQVTKAADVKTVKKLLAIKLEN